MIMFKIGTVDYSNIVIAEKYNVNKDKQYESWKDASGVEHRSLIRTQIKGAFSMFFKTIEDFTDFTQNIANLSNDDMSVPCIVCDNRTNTEQSIDAFIDFRAERYKNGTNQDTVGVVNINITER